MPMRRVAENATTATCAAWTGNAAATSRSIARSRLALRRLPRTCPSSSPARAPAGRSSGSRRGGHGRGRPARAAHRRPARARPATAAWRDSGREIPASDASVPAGPPRSRSRARSASKAPPRSRKKLICCVRPGVLLVNASRVRSASALIALDLPELDRPANAISGGPGGGICSSLATVRKNSACAPDASRRLASRVRGRGVGFGRVGRFRYNAMFLHDRIGAARASGPEAPPDCPPAPSGVTR